MSNFELPAENQEVKANPSVIACFLNCLNRDDPMSEFCSYIRTPAEFQSPPNVPVLPTRSDAPINPAYAARVASFLKKSGLKEALLASIERDIRKKEMNLGQYPEEIDTTAVANDDWVDRLITMLDFKRARAIMLQPPRPVRTHRQLPGITSYIKVPINDRLHLSVQLLRPFHLDMRFHIHVISVIVEYSFVSRRREPRRAVDIDFPTSSEVPYVYTRPRAKSVRRARNACV